MDKTKPIAESNNYNSKSTYLSLFPPYILGLVVYPVLVGAYFNIRLVEFADPLITLAYGVLLIALRHITGRNSFYYLAAVFLFLNGFIVLTHWIMMKGPLSGQSLFVVFNTNLEEATGFFQTRGGMIYLLILPYLILFVLSLKYTFHHPQRNRKKYYTAGLLIMAILFSLALKANKNGYREATPIFINAAFLFHRDVSKFENLENEIQQRRNAIPQPELLSPNKPRLVVLIEGESVNRNHMSLYGYYRETNPRLSNRNDIIIYSDVVSGYHTTWTSITGALTQTNLDNNIKPYEGFNIMDVCRAAGIKSYWLSNHSPIGFWNNFTTLLAKQSDEIKFVNITSNADMLVSYDDKLFAVLDETLKSEGDQKFIVVHLMGSHIKYETRYPSEFEEFKGQGLRDETIAHYDNSILYSDFIVDSLLNMIQSHATEKNMAAAVVYVSDHGENVYDVGDYAGHGYSDTLHDCLVEIPFLVWLSPQYEKEYPQRAEAVHSNAHLPYVSDDQFHTLIDLMAIKTELLETERSVFNQNFNAERKRIMVDGSDYDAEK